MGRESSVGDPRCDLPGLPEATEALPRAVLREVGGAMCAALEYSAPRTLHIASHVNLTRKMKPRHASQVTAFGNSALSSELVFRMRVSWQLGTKDGCGTGSFPKDASPRVQDTDGA